ncbi:MAG TPA: OFA family MFS transporter [Verrucomicrobiae bacterium]
MLQPTPALNRGRVVVLAALSVNLVLGALYGWGVFKKALVSDPRWHWSNTDAALPFTVSTISFALTMIFAGRAQDKLGPRYVAMLGGFMFGLGLMASSMAHTPLLMAISFGGIGGIGIGLGYSATTPPSIKWFPPARKGLITGIVVSGVGLAAVYNAPLTQFLLAKTGIPQTFLILGIGSAILVALFSQLLANPPPGYVACGAMDSLSAPVKASAVARPDLDWHEMLRTSQFYRLWFMFVLAASAGLMIIVHIATIAEEQAGLKWGFLPVAILALFNTGGRVVSGFLSDRIGRTKTMVLAFVLQALNMFLFSYYTNPWLLLFASAFTGLCYGTIFTLFPTATADFYGVRNLGVNYGFVFSAFGVAGTLGPILGGWVRDHYGAYGRSFTISAILLLVGAALALTLKAPTPEFACVGPDGNSAGTGRDSARPPV